MTPPVGMRWLSPPDAAYPAQLAAVVREPISVIGALDVARPALAIVGTRRPTPFGVRMARALARDAAKAGWVVVSGLARGIDSEAHDACLAAGGTTWAVLGCGLDRIYPPENVGLARRIVDAGGCLISEFALGTPPLRHHFKRRNRIVSGLCWATIVVEGGPTSGAINTAHHAAEQGRGVYALLVPADSDMAAAPFQLLKEGAQPLRTLADAWPDLCGYGGCAPQSSSTDSAPVDSFGRPLSLVEQKILEYLGPDARTLEQVGQAAALDIVRLSTILLDMELNGLIQSLPGQRYAQKSRA